MNFNEFSMYLFRWKRGGGGAHIHVYVWEHIVSLYYRTAEWMFMKLGRDEVLMVPYKCYCFSARSVKGRIQGGAKIGHGESPSSMNFLLQTGRLQQQTECIAMILKHVGRSVVTFGSILKSNFWRVFDIFLDFVILPYFNAISMDFYAVKCLIYIYFVWFSCL